MSFSGDFSGIENMGKRLAELSHVPSQAAAAAADDIADLMQAEFDAGTDPDGNPWEPLAASTVARGRHAPPLTDSSDMRDSIEVKPTAGAGIDISIDEDYWAWHQSGTANMPARPILPAGGEMPPAWSEAIARACDNAARRRMAGAR